MAACSEADTGPAAAFRNWDPALIDTLAPDGRVVTVPEPRRLTIGGWYHKVAGPNA